MATQSPPNIARLFMPRPPLRYLPACDRDPADLPRVRITGLASYFQLVKDELQNSNPPEISVKKTAKEEKLEKYKDYLEAEIKKWAPGKGDNISSDCYKTLFVARMSYKTTEKQLRHLFEEFGPVKFIRIVEDLNSKSRGYAFVEFERERDMRTAYRETNGIKVDNRRIIVDVERGRTVKDWLPKRLGGGLGNTRSKPVYTEKQAYNEEWLEESKSGYRKPRLGSSTHRPRKSNLELSPKRYHDGGSDSKSRSYRNSYGSSKSSFRDESHSNFKQSSRSRGYRGSPGKSSRSYQNYNTSSRSSKSSNIRSSKYS